MNKQSWLRQAGVASILIVTLLGGDAPGGEPEPLTARDRDTLRGYAEDTWKSFAAMADGVELPADGLRRSQAGKWEASPKTTPTDIGCYLWSTLAAQRLGIIREEEAVRRMGHTLDAIRRLDRVHGFFYEWIDPATGKPLRASPYTSRPIAATLSPVDNAWLATALVMIGNACPSLRRQADALLEPMDFAFFYMPYDRSDPARHPGLIHGPYIVDKKAFGGFNRILNTEQRIFDYIGMARRQIPPEHYFRSFRTFAPDDREQSQRPEGEYRTYLGVRVLEGHYRYRGMRIVPSWGGSMFEALMVTLFVPEETWAPRSWGVNHPLYVRAQIEHGLQEARYGFWGFSPASNPEGGYREYGVDAIGADPRGYTSYNGGVPAGRDAAPSSGRFRDGVVTPHASFLALRFAPRQAMDNLAKLRETFPIYREYGFMDSVNVSRGIVSDMVLALDQGMIMAAVANALADDAMRRAFCDGPVERVLRPLIEQEAFTAGEDRAGAQ